jgi:hypothetical protein
MGSGEAGRWIGVLVFNLGVAVFWFWAFRPATLAGDTLLAVGYLLIVVGCLPPLVSAIVRFVSSGVPRVAQDGDIDREESHGSSNATFTR